MDLDLAQFFDRAHHQRLLDRIGQRVADRRVVTLVRLMLKAAVVMPDSTRIIVREETPQGGLLSPLLSNIVLDELNQELARRGHRLVHYADTVTCSSAACERRVRLQVNGEKSPVRHSRANGSPAPAGQHMRQWCFFSG